MIIFNIIYIFVSVCLSIVWDTNWITGTNPWCMDGPTLSIEPLNKPTGNASTLYNYTIQLETNGIINQSIDQWNWTFGQTLAQIIVCVLLLQMFCGCLHFQQIYPPHNLICKAPVSLQQYIFRCKTVDGIQIKTQKFTNWISAILIKPKHEM